MVSDTSPLRALQALERVELLATVYGRVYLPPAVVDELSLPRLGLPAFKVRDHAFLTVRAPSDPAAVNRLRDELDAGESEALALAVELQADRVLIDRWPLRWSITRGQIVAATLPAGELGVKRVAGLPGDRLSIRGGDLYSGGQLIRKSPAELRQSLVLVHDNDHQPLKTKGLPPRWRPLEPQSDWRATGGEFRIQRAAESDAIDWIAYQHWACTGHPQKPRAAPSSVYDYDSYNQGENRSLHRVTDVLATCRVQSAGTVAFAASAGGERIQMAESPDAAIAMVRGLIESDIKGRAATRPRSRRPSAKR